MEPTMHCPGCGTEAPVTQKFCRSCGFSLEKVPQLVAEQLSESEGILTSKGAEKLQRRQQEIERWLSIAGIGFITLVAISFLIGLTCSLRSKPLSEREITSKPPLEAFEGPLLSITERTTNLLDKDDAVETRNERRKKP
jgi:hypothetical protein